MHSTRGGDEAAIPGQPGKAASEAGGKLVAIAAEIDRAGHGPDVVQHAADRAPRQRQHPGRGRHRGRQTLNGAVGHGAYFAEVLGDDEVRREVAQPVGIDHDDRAARVSNPLHLRVDRTARKRGVERRGRYARQMLYRGGVVALVGDRHQRPGAAEGRDDFGRAGKQRHDAHQRSVMRLGW